MVGCEWVMANGSVQRIIDKNPSDSAAGQLQRVLPQTKVK
jgi:hypothetical protein